MKTAKSEELYRRATPIMPGGVSSPVRSLRKVGMPPIFMAKGEGARVADEDGNVYIDHCLAWGPLILGHAHPAVVAAVRDIVGSGMLFGTCHRLEAELAARVVERIPSMEKLRFVSSGTEACMSAVRLARGATGRKLVVKFDGCYHGHSDFLLVQAGSGGLTFGVPDSAGVPAEAAALTLSLPYNDIEAFRAAMRARGAEVACVAVEPVAGNMGVVPPEPGFLEALREECDRAGALLLFDEVITGFRLAPGSAQARFGIRPDLTTLGKILGGGLPLAAYGGRADLMAKIAPDGPVYQAGTLSGNPPGLAAGIATLDLVTPALLSEIEARADRFARGLREAFAEAGRAATVNQVGPMLTVFLAQGPIRDLRDTERADAATFGRLFRALAQEGVYLPPSQFEAMFVSAAHTDEVLDRSVGAFRAALRAIA